MRKWLFALCDFVGVVTFFHLCWFVGHLTSLSAGSNLLVFVGVLVFTRFIISIPVWLYIVNFWDTHTIEIELVYFLLLQSCYVCKTCFDVKLAIILSVFISYLKKARIFGKAVFVYACI